MARRNKSVIRVRRLGWPVAAGRRRAGDGGEGVTAAAVALGGGVRSGLWAAATSMAAAVLGSRGGGSRGRRRHQAQIDEKPSVRGIAKEEVIWGEPFVPGEATTRDKILFCPGWWIHPGQKVFFGGPGKFPARGPPLVPGGSTTRDKRGPFSLVPA